MTVRGHPVLFNVDKALAYGEATGKQLFIF
jgi:hypothetical protein